jgi:hypothetical protein
MDAEGMLVAVEGGIISLSSGRPAFFRLHETQKKRKTAIHANRTAAGVDMLLVLFLICRFPDIERNRQSGYALGTCRRRSE